MIKINGSGTITLEKIENYIKKVGHSDIIIVLPNTKEQDVKNLKLIGDTYPNIVFSITGGLDPKKEKYNKEHYQKRTYFSAFQLSKIVSAYRNIEKNIQMDWTETEKAMYVYQQICNRMEYSELDINKKDYSRGIGGLLFNKAVCAGFAMIYKEALDRLGIECYYQNKRRCHSWNVAKLDGEYRALELTWDVSNKSEKGCEFYYFNTDEDFYSNKAHDIRSESEEKMFSIVPYKNEELVRAYQTIISEKVLKLNFEKNERGILEKKLKINDETISITKNNEGIININDYSDRKHKIFYRNDGSNFILMQDIKISNGLYRHLIFEEKNNVIYISKIFSENQLTQMPDEYDAIIANSLLNKERVKNKINNFNGYVGYIEKNKRRFYNENIERKELNIIRR